MNTQSQATMKTKGAVAAQAELDIVTKGSIAIMGSASALIGLWAIGCIIVAAFSAGPANLINGWITSVTGV